MQEYKTALQSGINSNHRADLVADKLQKSAREEELKAWR